MADLRERVAIVLAMFEEEDAEEEEVVMAMARIAAQEMMELEEGEGYVDAGDSSWTYVTVDINEYHRMPDSSFKLHFRMTRAIFEALLLTVGNHLVEMNRLKRERTPLADIVLMVLWIMSTPDSFRSVALRFGVRPSTLHYFYTYIIESLRELAPRFITWPSPEERAAIKNTFQQATRFPGVIGCVDCTHINITAPVQDAAPYFNRHHNYSINVQAVVDATLTVRHLHVGEVGSMNDNRIFKRSTLYHDLLHERDIVCNLDEHLLGDGAYTLTDFMMIPFSNNGHLTPDQLYFNRCLSQARVRVENAFGRGKGKWRRLKFLHARNPANVTDHITASFVLHNFIICHGEPLWEADELERPIRNDQVLDYEGEDEEEVVADNEDRVLQEAAEARGGEKRLFIMDVILNEDAGAEIEIDE